ncbi:MAG: hypothetical protein M3Q65_04910 [Chloroflexota bacterium]|nr:hypothetical protein [Chloroflexota bacterium]
MSGRRAAVPGGVFGKRPTALEKLTGGADQDGGTVPPSHSETVTPSNRETATPRNGETVEPLHGAAASAARDEGAAGGLRKTSFYLRTDQLDKLDELAYAYKRRTGRRIDRQDIVRQLVDRCALDDLLS